MTFCQNTNTNAYLLHFYLSDAVSFVRQDSDCGILDAGGQDTLPHKIMEKAVFLGDHFSLENVH